MGLLLLVLLLALAGSEGRESVPPGAAAPCVSSVGSADHARRTPEQPPPAGVGATTPSPSRFIHHPGPIDATPLAAAEAPEAPVRAARWLQATTTIISSFLRSVNNIRTIENSSVVGPAQ
jgi:hypothetical protein